MKLWITKNSEIPVRDQIVAQVKVAIASGDLRPGDKLPSTRELARRFGIHANTVSAAFRKLVMDGCVEFRKGSGIFVRENGADRLDVLLEGLFRDAAEAGFSKDKVLGRILNAKGSGAVVGFALFEPNDALAEIIAFEILMATGHTVTRIFKTDHLPLDSMLVALFDEEAKLRDTFDVTDFVLLNPNSVAGSLAGRTKPRAGDLVAVASGWDDFLSLAHLFLLSAGVEPNSICLCSTSEPGWKRGLATASMIICDTFTATEIQNYPHVVAFPIISPESLDELKGLASRDAVAPQESIPIH